jgi:lipopolysaccharide transport system ATP-binding protein
MTRFEEEDESVFWALRDINFEVKQGEVLGIIGHNGAGKSTLLKILSRITEPTSGRILVNGRIAALLEVGTGFHQDLTGRENIYMNGTILGMTRKEIDRKLDEIVDFSGVEKHLDTPVKFYSSGMKVRLGFAVAAHLEPEILIIDEVLAVGDAEFQKKCLGKMESVAGEGRTVLFVSHNMAAVKSLCEKGLVLVKGELSFQGDTASAVGKYMLSGGEYSNVRIFGEDYSLEYFTLKKISIKAVGKDIDAPFNEFDELHLETEFELKKDFNRLHYTYVLKDETGDPIFTFTHKHYNVELVNGINKLVCKLPKGFLNIGSYYLDAYLIKDSRDSVFVERDILSFNIQEGERTFGAWMGEEPGPIKPIFEWINKTI